MTLIDGKGYMDTPTLQQFEKILVPLGKQSGEFFLAASLFHARQLDRQSAAKLAGFSVSEFSQLLQEHFYNASSIQGNSDFKDLGSAEDLMDMMLHPMY